MNEGSPKKSKSGLITPLNRTAISVHREMPLSEGCEAELALIAATLANKQLQVAKSTSAYYVKTNEELAQENERLENELEKKEKENFTVMEALEVRMNAVKCDNAELKEKLTAARDSAWRDVMKEMASMQERLEESEYHTSSLQKRIEWLEEELASVDAFREARDKHQREMENLKKEYMEEQDKHARDSHSLRMQLMEERVRIRAEEQLLNRRHEEDVRKMAMELFTQKTREVDEENQQLLDEKIFLSGDAKAARDEADALRQENYKLRQNAEMAKSAEEEFTAHAARQKREITLLREQVKTTEDNLKAVVESYEQRLQKQAREHAAALRRLTQERDEANCSAESLRRELLKMRSLSRQMVERRTELEMFFYDALAQVRREILEERRRGTRYIGHQHPNSSTFQRTTQRIKEGEGELMLISNRRLRLPLPPPLQIGAGGSNTTWHSKESPAGDGNMGGPSLPLIMLPKEEVAVTRSSRIIPAKEWHYNESGALTTRFLPSSEEPFFAHSDLSSIPNAPKLRDLQSIEISQLSWKDKERVLQILFKQLQGKSNSSKAEQCKSTGDTGDLVGGVVVNSETNTFLTE
ncbi:hypothetical protein MOQ_003458 [Trypanosoma cruzi marinkellei]|uniref:Uncharacterized protein n=1 Tax=Trypanosoma cruzi marinkellei TaxID=85056 RepID=K2N045_TRYCR|nr:hypothetical protein MOQ_003458 [Trypanosoma cruzi marinkellei]